MAKKTTSGRFNSEPVVSGAVRQRNKTPFPKDWMQAHGPGANESRPLPPMSWVGSADGEAGEKILTCLLMAPEEYVGSYARSKSPEAALMRAVLEDAMICFNEQFLSRTHIAKHLGHRAKEWFLSDDSHWLFSFVSICTALDLDPDYIRKGLKPARQRYQHPLKSAHAMGTEVRRRVA